MFARRLRTLSVLLVFLAAPALADPAGPGMKEPARYAYIIGNATYSASPSGNLDDLVSACPEALAFRKSLIQIGVPAQNIYPLVTPGADGTVTDAAVRKAICNQTNQTLSSGLAQFVGMLMANNDEWAAQVEASSRRTGELLWRLPLHERYAEMVKGRFAQLTNLTERREAMPITAAQLLAHFAGEVPWAHVDIAGTGYDAQTGYIADAGATGFGVRLLVEIASSNA